MIIKALVDCYNDLLKQNKITEIYFVKTDVGIGMEIDIDGSIKNFYQLGDPSDKNPHIELVVPEHHGHNYGDNTPAFLCDKAEYILGYTQEPGKYEKIKMRNNYSKAYHLKLLKNCKGEFSMAIKNFYEHHCVVDLTGEQCDFLSAFPNAKIVFMYKGEYATNNPELTDAWRQYLKKNNENCPMGYSAVTGEYDYLEAQHPNLNGMNIPNKGKGCFLVSYGKDSFCSYGKKKKDKGYNFPIDKRSASAYASVLTYFTRNDSPYKMIAVPDKSIFLFWVRGTEKEYSSIFESLFANPFFNPDGDEEEKKKNAIMYQDHLRYIFECLSQGKPIRAGDKVLDYENDFYILELSCNMSRLVVRKFLKKDFGSVLRNVALHYNDLNIVKNYEEISGNITIRQLVNELYRKSTDKKNKIDAGVKNVMDQIFNSVLCGTIYPCQCLSLIINRIKVEPKVGTNYVKAAFLKAFINRRIRKTGFCGKLKEEISVSLNENSENIAYNLGRLFSIYLTVQKKVSNVECTIKQRFFAGAMSTPAITFPALNKLYLVHSEKLSEGYRIYYEKIVQDILDKIEFFPKRLTLEEQAVFYLGYYHQQKKSFEKKNVEEEKLDEQ